MKLQELRVLARRAGMKRQDATWQDVCAPLGKARHLGWQDATMSTQAGTTPLARCLRATCVV